MQNNEEFWTEQQVLTDLLAAQILFMALDLFLF